MSIKQSILARVVATGALVAAALVSPMGVGAANAAPTVSAHSGLADVSAFAYHGARDTYQQNMSHSEAQWVSAA